MPRTPRASIPLEPVDLTIEALATLDARSRKIIARGLGIGAVRVGQIEMEAARKLLALRDPSDAIETEIRCVNMPRGCFPAVSGHAPGRVYRFSAEVTIDIGDRHGGFWALRGVGEPRLEEMGCDQTGSGDG